MEASGHPGTPYVSHSVGPALNLHWGTWGDAEAAVRVFLQSGSLIQEPGASGDAKEIWVLPGPAQSLAQTFPMLHSAVPWLLCIRPFTADTNHYPQTTLLKAAKQTRTLINKDPSFAASH